jgi:hypothetical protein
VSAEQVPFDSLYGQGFVRVAVGVPPVRVADPRANGESTLALAQQASQRRAILKLCSPSSACPATARTICSTSRRYSTPSRAHWLAWRAPSDASAAAWLDELERNLLETAGPTALPVCLIFDPSCKV